MDIPKPRSILADVTTMNNKINRENTKEWPKIKAEPNDDDASETDLDNQYSIRDLIVFKEDLEDIMVHETSSKLCHYGVQTKKSSRDVIVFKEKLGDETSNKHSQYDAKYETHLSSRDFIVFEEDMPINMDNDVKPDKRNLGTVKEATKFQRRKTSVIKVKSEAKNEEGAILSEPDLAHHQSLKNSIVFKEDLEDLYENHTFDEEIVVKSEFLQGSMADLRDNTFAYCQNEIVKINEKKLNDKKQHKQIYTCTSKCGKKYTNKYYFDKHKCKTEYKCDHCGKRFHIKHKILEHMQIHILTGEINQLLYDQKCTLCPRKFKIKTSLEKHMEMHKNPHIIRELYECDICHKEFTLISSLKGHQKIHLGVGTVFKCDKCDKTYRTKAKFKLHKIKHGDYGISRKESIIQRCRYCSKEHYDKFSCNRHERFYCLSNPERSKSATRIMQCDICQKTYRRKRSLVDHILLHMGKQKPKKNVVKSQEVQCDVCFKKFTRKDNLKFHMECVHLKIKNHFCIKCKKGFTRKNILASHEKICQGISEKTSSGKKQQQRRNRK